MCNDLINNDLLCIWNAFMTLLNCNIMANDSLFRRCVFMQLHHTKFVWCTSRIGLRLLFFTLTTLTAIAPEFVLIRANLANVITPYRVQLKQLLLHFLLLLITKLTLINSVRRSHRCQRDSTVTKRPWD